MNRLTALALLLAAGFAHAQQSPSFPELVGEIDYFGYAGIPLEPIQAGLPIQPGDRIQEQAFKARLEEVQAFITRVTGHPYTDLDVVCCDPQNRLMLYLGLPGGSFRPLPVRPAPAGKDHLQPVALKLYRDDLEMLGPAITSGQGGEDDSNGYTLSAYAPQRAIQLHMRAYATAPDRTAEFERVLHEAAGKQDRQAAAMLLGYAPRSRRQVDALIFAADDADGEVRNNAIRALAVRPARSGNPAADRAALLRPVERPQQGELPADAFDGIPQPGAAAAAAQGGLAAAA